MSKKSVKRKSYPGEFKTEAIRLVEQPGSRTVADIVQSQGVAENMLQAWKQQHVTEHRNAVPARPMQRSYPRGDASSVRADASFLRRLVLPRGVEFEDSTDTDQLFARDRTLRSGSLSQHFNAVRPHSSLSYLTPNEFRKKYQSTQIHKNAGEVLLQ